LGAQTVEPAAQAAPEPVERFQSERRVQRLRGGFQGDARQQTGQQSRQDRGGYAMPWQYLGQEDGDGATAPAALASIGAKGPLTAGPLPVGVLGIVAHQAAVAIQRAATAAVRAALPLERKSAVCNAGSSRTKRMRGGEESIPASCPKIGDKAEPFAQAGPTDRTALQPTGLGSVRKEFQENGDGADGTPATLRA